MRRNRVIVSGVVAGAFSLFGPASAAGAHATFSGAPNGFPPDSEQALVLSVPHERDDATFNTEVLVAIPAAWQALSCEDKPTWSCTVGIVDGRQAVRFTKAAGAAPAEDESFRFSVRTASSEGTVSFPTVQTYNTGEVVRWIGGADSGEPAPQLSTLPGGAAPVPTAPTTTPTHDSTPAPTTPPTTPPPTATPTAPAGGVPNAPAAESTSTSGGQVTETTPSTSSVATTPAAPTSASTASASSSTSPSTTRTATSRSGTIDSSGVALAAAQDSSGDDSGGGVALVIGGLALAAAASAFAVWFALRRNRLRTAP